MAIWIVGFGTFFIIACGILFVWYNINRDREESKRWKERMETERIERNNELEMCRLGYVQAKVLVHDRPTGNFPFDGREQEYALAWVKPNAVENRAQSEAFKDLFGRMCEVYGIRVGRQTWEEAVDKINRREQLIKDALRDVREMRESLKGVHRNVTDIHNAAEGDLNASTQAGDGSGQSPKVVSPIEGGIQGSVSC